MSYARALLRILGLLLILSWAVPLEAQLNRGVIEGIVTDPQGAVVPGVDVTVTALDTNVSLPTKTNSAGSYRVVDLVPGKYRARFVASGFSPLDVENIEVSAGQVIRTDAQLKLGEARESVQVTAELPLLETAPANFSTTLETRTIQDFPLAGRDLQQLVFLVPGVVANGPPGSNFGFNSQFGAFPDPTHLQGTDVSVNGGQGGANAWYLDGNLNLSGAGESIVVNPSPDAVSEFQTITNAFSAEYGRTGGAVFNVVLKSGTNALHGNIYEYVRNSYFNARNPFTSISSTGQIIPQDQLRYNNFGGTLGGPVVLPHLYNGKDKTFFFFSWDSVILHLLGNQTFTVPTPAMRQGDFSEDPNVSLFGMWNAFTTVGPNAQGLFQRTAFGTPVAGNPYGSNGCLNSSVEAGASKGIPTCNFATQLPASMFDPTAMFFIKAFPQPNYLDPLSSCPLANGGASRICNNFLGTLGSSQDNQNISIKVDHKWSDKSRYFAEWLFNPGKYNNYRLPWTGPTFPTGLGFGGNLPFDSANQIITLGNTYTVSPTLINEFRVSFSRQYYNTHPATAGYPDSITQLSSVQKLIAPLKIPLYPPTVAPSWFVSTPGGGGMSFGPVGWVNNLQATEAYTVLDNVTKVVNKHTLKTGFMYRLEHTGEGQSPPTNINFSGDGIVDPTTGLGGGSGLAQFLLGDVQNRQYDAYATAAWEPYFRYRYWGFYLQDDYRITPRFTLNLGLRYDIFGAFKTRQHPNGRFCFSCLNSDTGLPGQVLYEGDPGFPKNSDVVPPNWNDFGPRINFSWSPFADRKTVIRGGYDVFFSNAYASQNSAQAAENGVGWALDYYFENSFFPSQCAPFSGQCVAFPLSDTTLDKAPLSTPPFSLTLPAQKRDPLYTTFLDSVEKPSRDPMMQTWGVEIQRELPGDVALTVGYVGTHGTHLVGSMWHNYDYVHTSDVLKYRTGLGAVVPITDFYSGQTATKLAQAWGASSLPISFLLRPYPFWPFIITTSSFDGNSIYHALDVRVQKRYSHGLSFIAAYTASKNLVSPYTGQLIATVIDPIHFARNGDVGGRTGALFGSAIGNSFQDPDNIKADRAVAFDDISQMLNLTTTYELPLGAGRRFANHKGIVNYLIGDWKLTGNFNAESGVPLTINGPCDGVTCRPDLIGSPKFSGSRSKEQRIAQWFNPAAFEPPFGSDQTFWANPNPNDDRWWQFGTAGLRLPGARSPGFWNIDTALFKQFHLTESKYFEFRWEMFNALNHQNLGLPNTGFCLPPKSDGTVDLVHQAGCSFGRITNIQTDPRSMEFALKFFW